MIRDWKNYKWNLQVHTAIPICVICRQGIQNSLFFHWKTLMELTIWEYLMYGKNSFVFKGNAIKNTVQWRQISSGHTYFILVLVEEYVAHDELSDMEPAETVTAHKAQGSEFEADSRQIGKEDIRYSNLIQKLQKSNISSCKNECRK